MENLLAKDEDERDTNRTPSGKKTDIPGASKKNLQNAIENGEESCVLDLLSSSKWDPKQLCQSWKPTDSGETTTPFRELIKYMPEIAKQVLDRCVLSDPKKGMNDNEFEVIFDYSLVEDHQEKTKRKTHQSSSDLELGKFSEDKEQTQLKRFNHLKRQDKHITRKYGPSFKKSKHPLALMVKYKRLDLLTHPVISSLLHHKWFHFGLWGYLLNLLIYVIFVTFLTSFALAVLNPQSTTCMKVFSNPGIAVCERGTEGMNATGEFTAESGSGLLANVTTGERNVTCVRCELSDTRSNFVFAAAVIVILSVVFRFLLEALQLCYDLMDYISSWVNWIEMTLYILSIIFVSAFRSTCLCPQEWQWQVGVIAILLAWIGLIVICAKFPSIGIYVLMFGRIFVTFLKVIVLSVLLVITFGITFYMTFSEVQFQRSPFYTPANTMLKILSMTAGDFSVDTVFRQSPSGESENAEDILFPSISCILWIIFVILMPVLFTNMLVGLAVGDIQQIEKGAKLSKLALQVDVILTVEQILRHAGIHKRFLCGKKTVHPNQKYNNTNPDHEEDERDICFGLFRHCLHCSQDSCLRLLAAIYFGLNELKYQLWEGERYDTLEALKPCLEINRKAQHVNTVNFSSTTQDSESKHQKDKHTEAIENVKQMMEKCMQALEELKVQNSKEELRQATGSNLEL